MRYARALVTMLVALAALAAAPQKAEAVTLKEIIELTKAKVSDDVILALIEIDQRVFPIDTETLAMLKQEGVSDRVMVAVVKSGRTPQAQPEPGALVQGPVEPPPPQIFVIDREPSTVREVVVPMPVYVAVPTATGKSRYGRRSVTSYDSFVPSIGLGPVTTPQPPPKPREPVYWGWGGKRRPDTWDPPPEQQSRPKKQ